MSFHPLLSLPSHPPFPRSLSLPPLPTRALPLHHPLALLHPPFTPLLLPPPLPLSSPPAPPIPHLLHCHDYRNGYSSACDDHPQPLLSPSSYAFAHFAHVDLFIYFTHHLITIPPPSLTSACHKENIPCLGTIIVEWAPGTSTLLRLLDQGEDGVDGLTRLCQYHRFDGYLVNVESPVPVDALPRLLQWLRLLRERLHTRLPRALLLWYDSVSAVTGEVMWQSHLHPSHTLPFYLATDGLFTDYHWHAHHPALSATHALDAGRYPATVWTGVDVWGRGTWGGGGWATTTALDVIRSAGTSAALFAPAWTLEGCGVEGDRERWRAVERRFWLGEEVVEIALSAASFSTVEEAMEEWTLVAGEGEEEEGREGLLRRWTVVEDEEKGKVLALGHKWGKREREVDLHASGVTEDMLAVHPLTVTLPYRGYPPNPADPCTVTLTLLSTGRASLLTHTLAPPLPQPRWQTLTATLHAPSDTRYLVVREEGRDAEGWAGWYGGRLGQGRVEVRKTGGAGAGGKGVGGLVTRRAACHWGRVYEWNQGCGTGRWREGRRVEGGQAEEEQAVDVGQFARREVDRTSGWTGTEWTHLEEQDVQRVVPDALRGGVMNGGLLCGLTEEVAYEGGTSVKVEGRGGGRGEGEAEFEVLLFEGGEVGEEEEDVMVRAVVKEGQGMQLGLVLVMVGGQRIHIRDEGDQGETLQAGWIRYSHTVRLRRVGLVAVHLRVLYSLSSVPSYLGQVYLAPVPVRPPPAAPTAPPSIPALLHYSCSYPSHLDRVTVYLVWLPPLTPSTPYLTPPVLSYELQLNSRWVGASRRSLYLLEDVRREELEGKRLTIGWREEDGTRHGEEHPGWPLHLEEGEEEEGGVDDEDEVAVWEAFVQAFCEPLDDALRAVVMEQCARMGLVGEGEQGRIQRALVARVSVRRGEVRQSVRAAIDPAVGGLGHTVESVGVVEMPRQRRPALRVKAKQRSVETEEVALQTAVAEALSAELPAALSARIRSALLSLVQTE